ncbi:MAG TPA: ABC transporter ATP-binding protein [Nitrospira sp.]|nr:ABC transporter ATP-binding protein [Nitrospira sp.]
MTQVGGALASQGLPKVASGPLLQVRNLTTQVASHGRASNAVDHLSLSVNRGEIVALVGETGSGKTMTALSVMRLLPPQAQTLEGTIALDGVNLLHLSEREMNRVRGGRIGLLFQQPRAALDPTCTIGAQVAEALQVHRHVPRHIAWTQAIGLLADVGIAEPESRAHSFAYQMSGGMAQRAMIAAALSGEPDLLIADEPTTSLDVTVQAQILKLLVEMRDERGLAILLITHDLAIVRAVADRVAVMYSGRIVEEGPTAEIVGLPKHPYTQALIHASLLDSDFGGRLYALPTGVNGERATGCRFCARCSLADSLGIRDHCQKEEPQLLTCGGSHTARCWGVNANAG